MKPTQADFLLRLAEDTFHTGSGTIDEMRRLGVEHAQRILEDEETLKKAVEINAADKRRFAQYLPQQRPELASGTKPPVAQLPLRKAAE